jgi:pimeloyl-ACP methyl ester carboxylesterase
VAASLAAFGVLAAGGLATVWRAWQRARAAEARWPAEGEQVSLGGVPVHVVMKGDGPHVVLIHGSSGSVRDFTFDLLPRLAARYTVLAVDRLGHGWSGSCVDSDRLAVQAQMVRQAAAVMGAARPIVVGHSYGGAVALRWALDAPTTVAGVVAVAAVAQPWDTGLPLFYRITSHPALRRIVNPLIAAWAPAATIETSVDGVFHPDPVPAGYNDHFGPMMSARIRTLIENARQRRHLLREVAAMAPLYAALDRPVEIVHGAEDATVGADHHARPLHRALPDANLTVLPGVGHMPHHARPDAVIAAIDRIAARDAGAIAPRSGPDADLAPRSALSPGVSSGPSPVTLPRPPG